jgi:hypothetical protein
MKIRGILLIRPPTSLSARHPSLSPPSLSPPSLSPPLSPPLSPSLLHTLFQQDLVVLLTKEDGIVVSEGCKFIINGLSEVSIVAKFNESDVSFPTQA